MNISLTSFTAGIQDYLRNHQGALNGPEQTALCEFANRTFENRQEANLELTDLVDKFQLSRNPELVLFIQNLFHREIQKLPSSISDLSLDELAHIFSFLDLRSQRQAEKTCRTWHDAMHLVRVLDLERIGDLDRVRVLLAPLYAPKFTSLLSLFGITLPPQNASPIDVEAACEDLFEILSVIQKGIKQSKVLDAKESKPFCTMPLQEIAQDPSLLYRLLNRAYESSLVAPFLNDKNPGPDLSEAQTLTEKAHAVRNFLTENGDSCRSLNCANCYLLCFPKEFCNLKNLQLLDLHCNFITSVPMEISHLTQLQSLDLSENEIVTLPLEFGRLEELRNLRIAYNALVTIPHEFGQLKKLQDLDLSSNNLITIPKEFGQLTQLNFLNLSKNELETLPEAISHLVEIRSLDLSDNIIEALPSGLHNLTRLYFLDFSHNNFEIFPDEIINFSQSIQIRLLENFFTQLPKLPENITILTS
jgi:Leucine-rich repeat (LRR) protein